MRSVRHSFAAVLVALSLSPAWAQFMDMNTQIKGSRLPSWSTDSGAANAYALTSIRDIGSGNTLQTGSCFKFIAAHANTTASTVTINGGSAIAITRADGTTALSAGDIAAGLTEICYDGTNFRLVGGGGSGGGLSGLTLNGAVYATGSSTITSTPGMTDGQLLIGDSSGAPQLNTITAGTGVSVTNAHHAITIATSGAAASSNVWSLAHYWTSTGTHNATSLAIGAVSTGQLLVAEMHGESSATDPLTVTSSACTSNWTLAKKDISGAEKVWMYYCVATSNQASDTVTTNMTANRCGMIVLEFNIFGGSYAASPVAVDVAGSTHPGSVSSTTVSSSPTNQSELLVSALAAQACIAVYGLTVSPATYITNETGDSPLFCQSNAAMAYMITPAETAYSDAWTITGGPADSTQVDAVFSVEVSTKAYYQTDQVDGTAQTQELINDFVSGTGISLSGADDSANNRTKVTMNIANTGVSAGSCGDSTHSCSVTVNAQGQLTALSNNAIATGGTTAMVQICSASASSSASLKFDSTHNCSGGNPFTSSYRYYKIEISGWIPASNDVPVLQFSTNGGSSYDTSGVYYWDGYFIQVGSTSGPGVNATGSQTYLTLFADSGPSAQGIKSTGTPGLAMTFEISDPLSSSNYKIMYGQGIGLYAGNSNNYSVSWFGYYLNTNAVNSFKLFNANGANITAAEVRVYGYTN